MSAAINFNANNVKPNATPEPLPNGEYTAVIASSDITPTANGRGRLLKLELQVSAPEEFKGRKIWDQLCIQHENTKTQEIAQGQLSAICHATGVLQLSNSSQLHGIPMKVRVIVDQNPGYAPRNEVKGYKAIDGGAPASVTPVASAASAPAANAPAWAQKKSA